MGKGRRQETTHPSPLHSRGRGRQETEEMGMSEKVGVSNCQNDFSA
ncbi:hypothetical protein [Okeania sp. SIO2B3]|nr:hypothetical protein [Okeania sp. SIO2B3]NET40517.1 hypothetical protein [Okeania sp. SIO2B3]